MQVSFNRRTAMGIAGGAIVTSLVAKSAVAVAQQSGPAEAVKPRAAAFKVGTQNDSSDEALRFLQRWA